MACASAEDRDEWVRCIRIIINMKNLGIDSSKVNIFTFEQFQKYQLDLLSKQCGIETIEQAVEEEPINSDI